DSYYKAQDEFSARQKDFAAKLERCRLKETIGWVDWWHQEEDENHNRIPDKNHVGVYVYNPFYGFGKDLREDIDDDPEMLLADLHPGSADGRSEQAGCELRYTPTQTGPADGQNRSDC